jgi:hypothetical protein
MYVGDILSNAAGTQLCSDDVVRLSIDWVDLYHEAHFAVIRLVDHNTDGLRSGTLFAAIYRVRIHQKQTFFDF